MKGTAMKALAMTSNCDGRHGRVRGGVLALGAALLFSLVHASAVYADNAKIGIDNFAFTPRVLTVKVGTTVVFENHDDIPHLVVDAGGKFRSKALDTNDSFSVTFDKPGEIAYFCGLHPHMKGKIIVAP
jgi:plastocyanin